LFHFAICPSEAANGKDPRPNIRSCKPAKCLSSLVVRTIIVPYGKTAFSIICGLKKMGFRPTRSSTAVRRARL
ncbi:MAG: hypothetical protein ACO20X_13790, partial [Alphaproteobacteria bacterium]